MPAFRCLAACPRWKDWKGREMNWKDPVTVDSDAPHGRPVWEKKKSHGEAPAHNRIFHRAGSALRNGRSQTPSPSTRHPVIYNPEKDIKRWNGYNRHGREGPSAPSCQKLSP